MIDFVRDRNSNGAEMTAESKGHTVFLAMDMSHELRKVAACGGFAPEDDEQTAATGRGPRLGGKIDG